MADTAIEWADSVWNPTTGCDRVSDGCDNCYALTLAKRLSGMGSPKYQNDGDPRTSGPGFGLTVHPGALPIPLRWQKPRRIFVDSMSDLFHDQVPDEFIAQVFAVMHDAEQHIFQLLTKRHGRMRSLLGSDRFYDMVVGELTTLRASWQHYQNPGLRWPLPNLWLGVSVEDQKWADIRIPALLDTPAAVRWLSCEPLLGPIDLFGDVKKPGPAVIRTGYSYRTDYGTGIEYDVDDQSGIDWVVVGGESGPGARPMHPDWARSLRDQCEATGVPFFFKQWGQHRWVAGSRYDNETQCWVDDGVEPQRVGKKLAGRELDGRTWDEYPEVPAGGS